MPEDWRRDATDKMTFGEMRKTNIENLKLVQIQCKEYVFDSLNDALKWTNEAMQGICMKFGVDKNKIIHNALNMPLDSIPVRQVMKENPTLEGKVDPRKLYASKVLTDKMVEADLYSEDRKFEGKDAWRSGSYFHHHNEIAYFISAPYRRKGGHYQTPHIIVPTFGKWFIQSNWTEPVKVVS
jgi:hypothetical protein